MKFRPYRVAYSEKASNSIREECNYNNHQLYYLSHHAQNGNNENSANYIHRNNGNDYPRIIDPSNCSKRDHISHEDSVNDFSEFVIRKGSGGMCIEKKVPRQPIAYRTDSHQHDIFVFPNQNKKTNDTSEEEIKGALFGKTLNYLYRYNNSSNDSSAISDTVSIKKEDKQEQCHWRYQISQSLVQPSVFLSHNTFAHAFWDDDSNLQKQKDSQQSTEINNSKSNQNLGYNNNEFGFVIDPKVMKKRKLNNNNKNEESSLIHSDSYSVALELANPNNRQKKRKNVLEEEPNHKNKDDYVEESVISITPKSTFPPQDREASTTLFVFSSSVIEPFFIRNEQDWIAILSQQEQAQDTVVDVIGTSSSAYAIGSKKWFVKRKTQWRLHRALRRISNSNEGTHHHNQLDGCTDFIPLLQIDPKIPDGHNNDVRVQQNTDNQDQATLSSFPKTTTSMDIMSHLQFTRKNNSRSSEISIVAPSRQTQTSQTVKSWIFNHHAPVNELFTTSRMDNTSQDAGIGLKSLLEEQKQYLYDPAKKNPFTSDDQVDSNSTGITSNETSTTTYSPSYIRTNQDIPILSEEKEKEKACQSSFVFPNTEQTKSSQKILHQLHQHQQQKQQQHDEYEYPHHRIQTQTLTCTTNSQQTQFDLMISKRHILNTKMFKSTLLTLGGSSSRSNSSSDIDVKFSPLFIPHLVNKKSLATKVIRHGGSDGVGEESKKKKQKETLEMKSLVRKIVNTTTNDSCEEIEESYLQMLNQVEKSSSGYPIKQAAITANNTASNLFSPSERNQGSKLSTTFIGKGKLKMKISSTSHQIIQQQKECMNASKKLHDFWNLLLTGCQAQRKKNVNGNSSGLSFVYQGFLSGQYVNSTIYERRYRNMIRVLKNEQELKLENRRLATVRNDDNAIASPSSSSAVDMALGYLQMYSHLSRIPFLLLNNTTTEKTGSKKKRANTNKIIKNNNASLSLFCKSNKRRRLEQEENSITCKTLHGNCDEGKDSKGDNIDKVRDDVRVDSFEEYCHKVSILNTSRRNNKLALDNSTTASSPSSSPNKEDHSILFWDHLENQMERISEHSVLLRAELNHLLLKAFEISRKEKEHEEEEDYRQCDIMELNEVFQDENDNDVETTQLKKVPRTSDDIVDNKNSTREKKIKKKKSKKKKKKKRKHKKERKEREEEEETRHQSKKKKMQYNHSDCVKQDSSYDFTDNHDEPVERKLDFTNEEKEERTTCSSTQHPTPTGARAIVVQDSLKYVATTEDTVRKQLEFDKPHNSQSHQQDQLHLQCYDEDDKENMLPILENNNHRLNHHKNNSSFNVNSHDKMTNNNAAKMPFTSHNVIPVKTNQGQHNHPPQPFEDFDTPITILCSESFLEMTTSSKSISELATGQWANNFISQSRNSHSMDFTTQIQTHPTKGRKIKLLDCPLIDECLVDLELPDNRSAIIVIPLSTWDISDDVPGTSKGKEFVRKLVQLLSMGRYSKIHVFFCIDNNNNDSSVHNAVKDEISMVQSAFSLQDGCHFCDSLNFQYVSQINLSFCIAERVLEAYNNNRNESESEIIHNSNNILLENFAHDLNIQEKARFLIQIAPSLNVSGVLKRMICYSQRYSKEGKISSADPNISQFNFQRFLRDFLVVEKEEMISKDSQKKNSMWWQLSLALNAMLVNE